ncbi:MAG: disulfide bond formation protein B [Candidatus Staskawiczbacteria bacterium]|nr:disulfide bond formation protein B [Candidatus Staskawiczbacteria bacterium]
MQTTDFITKLLSLGVIIGQIFILCAVLYFIFWRKTQNSIAEFIGKRGLLLAFIVTLISILGSLYYSNIVGFPPCELCWFQRIFMYPLFFLLGLALIKKETHITVYALMLAIIGGIISLYHNYMYYYNQGLDSFCQLGGTQVSCIKQYVFEFGYVTIPLMALTAFILIAIFLVVYRCRRTPTN